MSGKEITIVLADDHARHGFEHFTGAHDGTLIDLPPRHHALRGGMGDADQAVAIRQIDQVERAFAGDRDVGFEREGEGDLQSQRRTLGYPDVGSTEPAEARSGHLDYE